MKSFFQNAVIFAGILVIGFVVIAGIDRTLHEFVAPWTDVFIKTWIAVGFVGMLVVIAIGVTKGRDGDR